MKCKSGKVLYGDKKRALIAAIRCIELGILRDVQTYICPFCKHYHLRTAKVQLHNWFWRPTRLWPERVRNWFNQRGTIDLWDNE